MLVEVVLELLELLVRDHVGIADIAGDRIPLRQMADHMDRVADGPVTNILSNCL